MKLSVRCAVAIFVAWTFSGAVAQAVQPDEIASDTSGVYRLQPSLEGSEWVLVPSAEVQTGLVYNYYHDGLARRVWGLAGEGGSFQYAFGEGTVIKTDRFDLQLSPEMQRAIIEGRSPGLEEALKTFGGVPCVELDANDEWDLLPRRSTNQVIDIATGQRWEWHGGNRMGIVHTSGNSWKFVDGEFVPLYDDGGCCY